MTFPRTVAARTHRSLGPPRLLARLLRSTPGRSGAATWPSAHGATAGIQGSGNDFTAAASPFCSNLRQLLLPPAVH